MVEIDIYTDGACSGNPGPGGWATVLLYKGQEKEISGFVEHTTNNRMELLAAIKGLSALKKACVVNLYSDSAYMINAFKKNWIDKWKVNNWKTSKKTDVENKDLWLELIKLVDIHMVNWIKVKGHRDNKYNNICDQLAVGQIKSNT